MKRSEYIAIGAVGLLAVAAFWPRSVTTVGGSMDETNPDAQAFSTAEECRAAPGMTNEVCDGAFASAQQTAVANAPRFDTQTSCEAQFGPSQCRSTNWNGASVFVPVLVGALVGRSLANAAQPQSQPLFPPRAGPANCPQGSSTPNQPGCAPQSRTSSGGSGGVAWNSGRTYSTGSGTTVTRPLGPDARVRYDARPRSPATSGTSSTTTRNSSGTVSRSGFGSTGSSVSSGS